MVTTLYLFEHNHTIVGDNRPTVLMEDIV